MRDQIDKLIRQQDFEALSPLLDSASIQRFRTTAGQISHVFQDDDDALLACLDQLSTSNETPLQQLACQLIPHVYAVKRKKATGVLPQLIESTDWTVRDAACEVTGRLLREDFSRMLAELEMWRTRDSANLHRAVIIASIRAADSMHLERAEPLLKLLEPLLIETDPLVRRNLGPSAIGIHLLAQYPSLAFEYLAKWSTSNDPQTLWHVAMAFSGPPAVDIAKKALIVLRKLSLDERRFVWRAVAASLWKLGRKRPDIIRPELARWLEDERRVKVAREAIKYL